jgi:hypothetical protein
LRNQESRHELPDKQLPTLKAALLAHQAARLAPATSDNSLAGTDEAA